MHRKLAHRRHLILPIPTLLALATLARAADTAVTWDGSIGNWTDSTHWSLPAGEYPTADNPPGSTYAVTINHGTINLGGATYTVDALDMNGGTLASGTLVLAGGGQLPGNSMILDSGFVLENQGTLTVGNATLSANTTSATQSPRFVNSGLLVVDAGANGVFAIDGLMPNGTVPSPVTAFSNSGNINILSGTLLIRVADDGNSTGAFSISAGATLQLDGQLTFGADSSIEGAGNVFFGYTGFDSAFPTAALNGAYAVTGTTDIERPTVLNGTASMGVATIRANVTGTGSLIINGSFTIENSSLALAHVVLNGNGKLDTQVLPAQLDANGLDTIGGSNSPSFDGVSLTVGAKGVVSIENGLYLSLTNTTSVTNNGILRIQAAVGYQGTAQNPVGTITNNGTISIGAGFQYTTFNNNGTANVSGGTFASYTAAGADSPSSTLAINAGSFLIAFRPLLTGSLLNAGTIRVSAGAGNSETLGSGLTFQHTGAADIQSGTLFLAAPQQPATTGTFMIESAGVLEFAASYDFSSPTGPSFTHNTNGDGLLIVDPGITLTLPSDTAFAGTIDVYGMLVVASPLDPADAGLAPNFTVVMETPEPASLALLALASPLILRRRGRRAVAFQQEKTP